MDHSQHILETTTRGSLNPENIERHEHMGTENLSEHGKNVHTNMLQHVMSMTFHFGYNEKILFDQWDINTIGGLISSIIAIFIMATLYEGLKYYREFLFWKTYNLLEYRPVTVPGKAIGPETSNNAQSVHYVGEVIHKQPPSMMSLMHFYQTILHIVQVTISFLLMLIFMTYNVWLCLAVVFGAGTGYFLFSWKKSVIVDVTEHCH